MPLIELTHAKMAQLDTGLRELGMFFGILREKICLRVRAPDAHRSCAILCATAVMFISIAAAAAEQVDARTTVAGDATDEAVRLQRLYEVRRALAAAEEEAAAAKARLESICRQRGSEAASCLERAAAQAYRPSWPRAVVSRIESNWLRPPIEETGPDGCTALITLATGGEVTDIRFDPPCASDALQASVKRAIAVSSPFPLPDDPTQFRSQIRARFTPIE